jgi:hypothetical protein
MFVRQMQYVLPAEGDMRLCPLAPPSGIIFYTKFFVIFIVIRQTLLLSAL